MKELLIKLRYHVLTNGILSGLCGVITYKLDATKKEKWMLLKYIKDHQPTSGKHYNPEYSDKGWYYWPEGEMEPRINWLNDKIKRFK